MYFESLSSKVKVSRSKLTHTKAMALTVFRTWGRYNHLSAAVIFSKKNPNRKSGLILSNIFEPLCVKRRFMHSK